ncbi:MAG: chloramphenicol acetyltransferase [Acholeplasmataceae bacterium]|nr:chloramphenicol acetyltransferase [Acholeplasmataceae bacterium]
MKVIDLENWKGKKHYLWFREYAHPYYCITNKVDITNFYRYLKANSLPFFASLVYLVTKALNEIEEFRLRIKDDQVVLYEVIHPAFTMMTDEGIYDNCSAEMAPFPEYLKDVISKMDAIKKGQMTGPKNYHEETRLDQYYLTCLPWIDFTSVTHPMTDDPKDTIPRIAWGKYYENNGKMEMAFSIQANHALIDGYPLSLGFLKVQEYLNHPEAILS